MESLKQKLTNIVSSAFAECQYDSKYGEVAFSARRDLCQFQCNGALSAAKIYKCNPMNIAENVTKILESKPEISEAIPCRPGFINIKLTDSFLAKHIESMSKDNKLGVEEIINKKTIIIDYGGPNVGKPLHVGHLRPAIIGESLKRIARYLGHEVIGDVHLGDWGLQMGMIIAELASKNPEWNYFDKDYKGPYSEESPITNTDFEKTYPEASKKAKADEEIMAKSRNATIELQEGRPGYRALWKHFLNISKTDLKKSYDNLFVEFDLWYGESDVQEIIPSLIEKMKKEGYAYESEGALVVDVAKDDDKIDIPPFMLVKSDGASLYSTTDLATIEQRAVEFSPDEIWYVVDSRQTLHFKQLFRCVHKTNMVKDDIELLHLGFGTMNGEDGKPFKTRDGGVMKLNELIKTIEEKALEKIKDANAIKGIDIDKEYTEEEKKHIVQLVGVAALKYADLMNLRTKDYVFDIDRFTSFEGRTGSYLLYSTVRLKSILRKAKEKDLNIGEISTPSSDIERDLLLKISEFSNILGRVCVDKTPNQLSEYVYDLASEANRFYHKHKIMEEKNTILQSNWLALMSFSHDILQKCLELLGIKVPEKL